MTENKFHKLQDWFPTFFLISLQLLLLPFVEPETNRFSIERMVEIPIAYWMFTPWGCISGFVVLLTSLLYAFRKKKSVCLPFKQQIIICLIFLLFYIFCNPYVTTTWTHIPAALIFSSAVLTLSVGLAGRFAIVVWTVIFLMAFFVVGLSLNNVNISADVMAQIFTTSQRDAARYMTLMNFSILVLSILFSIALSYGIWRVVRYFERPTLLAYGSMCLFLSLVFMYAARFCLPSSSRLMWPIINAQEMVNLSKNAVKQIRHTRMIMSMLPEESQIGDCSISTIGKDAGVVVILHVGESVNGAHCSINGYSRNTTPWLASQSSLINFKDCISSAASTDYAVLTMLTNGRRSVANSKDRTMMPSSPGIMDIFHKTGFRCYGLWDKCYVDNSLDNLFTNMVRYFSRNADGVFGYEGDLANQLTDVFFVLDKGDKNNIFMMINNNGSHCYYHSYDKASPPFHVLRTPTANFTPHTNREHADIYLNAYDSTIHYMDTYIRRIVEYMQGRPYIYIYMSDHGEYLGEGGYWTRGSAPSNKYYDYHACCIPFFILYSPEFEQLHPHFRNALAQLRKAQETSTAHEHLFHTLHGIMGISSKYYNPNLDLTRKEVLPYTGPHPDRK